MKRLLFVLICWFVFDTSSIHSQTIGLTTEFHDLTNQTKTYSNYFASNYEPNFQQQSAIPKLQLNPQKSKQANS